LNYLLQLWEAIEKAAAERSAPFLIYQESNVIIRALRDYLRSDISEIIVDEKQCYDRVREFMQLVMPHNLEKVHLYHEKVPLFTRFQIESQIETAFQREVRLPSGGAIVMDHTEALVSIDINSSRATKGGDIEETALNTNCEAAEEIARQLRLRDLGGLIVIDFIDMTNSRNQREVENTLKEALKMDRARVQIGRISRFGLLEMSRQRLRPSLGESSQVVCPRCQGQGTIRGTESLALSILRIIEEEAIKEHTAKIVVQLPVNVATYLLNEKRQALLEIEERQKLNLILLPNETFETPHYDIQRIRKSDIQQGAPVKSSYDMTFEREEAPESMAETQKAPIEEPAVKSVVPSQPAPPPAVKKQGLLSRIMASLFGSTETSTKSVEKSRPSTARRGGQSRQQQFTRGGSQRQSSRKRSQQRRDTKKRSDRSDRGDRGDRGDRKSASGSSGTSGGGKDNRGQTQPSQAKSGTPAESQKAKPETVEQSQQAPQSQSAQQAPQESKQADAGKSGSQQQRGGEKGDSSKNVRRGRRGGRRRRRDETKGPNNAESKSTSSEDDKQNVAANTDREKQSTNAQAEHRSQEENTANTPSRSDGSSSNTNSSYSSDARGHSQTSSDESRSVQSQNDTTTSFSSEKNDSQSSDNSTSSKDMSSSPSSRTEHSASNEQRTSGHSSQTFSSQSSAQDNQRSNVSNDDYPANKPSHESSSHALTTAAETSTSYSNTANSSASAPQSSSSNASADTKGTDSSQREYNQAPPAPQQAASMAPAQSPVSNMPRQDYKPNIPSHAVSSPASQVSNNSEQRPSYSAGQATPTTASTHGKQNEQSNSSFGSHNQSSEHREQHQTDRSRSEKDDTQQQDDSNFKNSQDN